MGCQVLVDTGCEIESRRLRRLDLPVKKNTRILALRFLNPFQRVQTCHSVLIRLVGSRLLEDLVQIFLVSKGYFRCTKLIPFVLFCGPQLFWGPLGKNLDMGRW